MAPNTNLIGCFYILISVIILTMINTCHSVNFSDDELHQNLQPQKVNLTLYYETLCSDAQSFIVDHLVRVFDSDLKFTVNLHLVPFGNARIFKNNKTINCQHGPLEDYYNTIEACALHVWPLQKQKDTYMWQLCANNLKLNPQSILNCYTSGLGNKLILQNAEETLKLNPPPKYLPWVAVNNEPLFRDYNNVIKYICDAHRGKSKPSACKSTISVLQTPSLCDPPEAKLRESFELAPGTWWAFKMGSKASKSIEKSSVNDGSCTIVFRFLDGNFSMDLDSSDLHFN